MSDDQHFINPELQKLARESVSQFAKDAFVPGGDPSMMAGDPMAGGGAPPPPGGPPMGGPPPGGGGPPMDPAMMGMDPSMMGMDPSMMGGPPPPPPGGGGGEDIRAIIKEELAASGLTGGGAAAAGPAGGIKPKIDVNVELMQIKKMLAKLSDAMGVQIPAADMVATEEDLNAMAAEQQGGPEGPGGPPESAIKPIDPMGAAMPMPPPPGPKGVEASDAYKGNGMAYDGAGLTVVANKAAAISRIIGRRG